MTHSASPAPAKIYWLTFDPHHNRVLYKITTTKSKVYSFDIETGKTDTVIDIRRYYEKLAYDPATGLFFADVGNTNKSVYSYQLKSGSNKKYSEKFVVNLPNPILSLTVDSCGGYVTSSQLDFLTIS